MALKSTLRRLEKASATEMITVELVGGSSARFQHDVIWNEVIGHEYERGKRHYRGEDPGPAHPFVEALRQATPERLERLIAERGTCIRHYLGQDAVYRRVIDRGGGG